MKIKRFIAIAASVLIAFPSAFRTDNFVLRTADAAGISSVTFTNFDSRINGGEPIRGVDISSVISLEEAGVKFYDDNGNEQDIFRTLADHGVNYIRVRIWNEPHDDSGNTYGGGHSDLETAAKIGNETNCFFCNEKDMNKICDLFASGEKAVRDYDRNILIAHHFANPGSGHFDWYAQVMNDCRLDYDVFACSYYSYWHGSLDNMQKVLTGIGNKYNKYVMVVETAYPYTNNDGDNFGNTVTSSSKDVDLRYDISVDGQARAITDVFQTVANCNGHGIGVFYWEPAWLGVPDISWQQQKQLWDKYGSGWATSYAKGYDKDVTESGGSSFDNQALFDFHGKPLESLDVFLNVYPQKKPVVTTTTTTTTTSTTTTTTTTTTSTTTTTTTTTTVTTTTMPTQTVTEVRGDINHDGVIDSFDLIAFRKIVLSDKKPLAHYDLNSDGEVGIADLVKLQRFILGYKDDDFIMITFYTTNT